MLTKNPSKRISSDEALQHPAFTIVLSQSPLITRSFFDNKELINYTKITGQYDQKQINTKKLKKSFGIVPDKIHDMSPKPHSPNKNDKSKNAKKSPLKKSPLKKSPLKQLSPLNYKGSNSKNNQNIFGSKI